MKNGSGQRGISSAFAEHLDKMLRAAGACVEDGAGIVQRANASSDGKRDEQLARGPPNGFEKGGAFLVGCGDIEEHDFIRSRRTVAGGQLRRVPGIAQIKKLPAFDD